MDGLIYRGTPPVGPAATQALLAGPFAAVWSPPMFRRADVSEGDRLWLVWQGERGAPRLLGAGVIQFTPEGRADWTNRTAPGVVQAARDRGYGGPTNMAFIRLCNVRIAVERPDVLELGDVPVGLSSASSQQVDVLTSLLPVLMCGGRTDLSGRRAFGER